ncbi:uncharacterized protein METZ01_LOCUS435321, partial [marine metagenome]
MGKIIEAAQPSVPLALSLRPLSHGCPVGGWLFSPIEPEYFSN